MPPQDSPAVRRPPTIYIADDNAIFLQGLRRAFVAHGYQVRTASDGASMLEMLRSPEADPDLLLLDMMMPEVDGLEVLRLLQADERLRRIPAILLTAATTDELTDLALDPARVDVLLKPFGLGELLDRVASRIGGSPAGKDAAGADSIEMGEVR
jgi:CheY-like chemotaxis protein